MPVITADDDVTQPLDVTEEDIVGEFDAVIDADKEQAGGNAATDVETKDGASPEKASDKERKAA